MQQPDFYDLFVSRLNDLNIDYLVTGSVASILYGMPRLTHDIDLVLHLDKRQMSRFIPAFPSHEYYCPPSECIEEEIGRSAGGHFNLIHHSTGLKADIYLYGNDPLHTWAFENKKKIEIRPEQAMWVAPPEYVILRKLEYFKEGGSSKHISDIENVLEVNSDAIDMAFLLFQIKKRNLIPIAKKCPHLSSME